IEHHEVKGGYSSIPKLPVKRLYELSSAQKRMYFLYEFDKQSTSYNIPSFYHLDTSIDIARLKDAFNSLVQRHSSLRTRFVLNNNEVYQQVMGGQDFNIIYTELADGVTIEDKIQAFISPFNLNEEYPFRVEVVKDTEGYILLIDMHHIVSDGVSMSILMDDFVHLYQEDSLPELSLQYTDYSEWQQSEAHSLQREEDKKYWEGMYASPISALDLPYDYTRPAIKSDKGSSVTLTIDSDKVNKIRSLVDIQGVSMFMFLLSIHKIVLSKLSGQEDIIVGTPTSGRNHADVDQMVGMFVNTLVLRSYPSKEKSYIDYLEEVKELVLSSFVHEAYQYEDLIESLSITRDTSRNPLFDVMFTYRYQERRREEEIEELPFGIRPYEIGGDVTSKFDLEFDVSDNGEELSFAITYCTALFKSSTIETYMSYIETCIDQVLEKSDRNISEISLLNKEE
ncbi:condensation domain-containing protein, partial [Tenacibaculum sp. M341]|uniref:condensation domain-containing protein n=2 Tax=Tenacibaculum TaxID=104267 RepID=UPI001FB2FC9D